MAENIIFAHDNRADDATFTLGSWYAALPLNNLKTFDTLEVARSSSASAANTKFLCDFGYSCPLSLIALIGDNLTDAATVRLRAGPNADGSSPILDVTLNATDFGDFRSLVGRVIYYATAAGEFIYARYILVEVTDTSNPDGYVQFSRFVGAPGFQPELNMAYGARTQFIDDTRITHTINRTQFADIEPKARRIEAEFQLLDEEEALSSVYEMQRLRGISEPFLTIFDPTMTGDDGARLVVYGTLVDLVDTTATEPGEVEGEDRYSWRVTLEESA